MKRFLPFILWTLIIFALCSMPGKAIPKISWLELLSFDKFVHASIFFVEQVLFMRALSYLNKKNLYGIMALLFCMAYGGSLELMQYYIFSSRSGDVLDFIANSTGALTGFLLFSKINKKLGFLPA
ncbi:MAG TPA: VanZ family protein [Bacteroidia bacterium]|nr:VanZ family protein [Bacteroidia bacterium]